MRYLKIMFVVLAVLISGYLIAQDQDVIIQRDVIQNGQGDADATFEMPTPPPGSFFFHFITHGNGRQSR